MEGVIRQGIKRRWNWLIPSSLFLVSLILRLSFLNAGLFHHDSVQLAMAVEKSADEFAIQPIGGGRHGLVLIDTIVFYFFSVFFGHTSAEFAVNFSSALFGALAIPLLYLFAMELTGSARISVFSALAYSVTPIFLSVSTFAKDHTLSVFLVLLAFYLLTLSIKKNKNVYAALSGAAFGFSLLVREINILLVFSIAYFLLSYSNKISPSVNKKRLFSWFISMVAVFTVILIILINPILKQQITRSFGTFVIDQITYSLSGILITLTWLGAALLLYGIWLLHNGRKELLFFFALWFLPLFAFYTLSSVVDHRFFSEAIIPLIIVISLATDSLGRFHRYLPYAAVAILIVWMLWSIYPAMQARHENSSMKEFSSMVREKLGPDAVIMLYGDNQIFLNYYQNITTIPCEPNLDMENSKKFVGLVYGDLLANRSVYMSTECFSIGSLEEKQHFYRLMFYNFRFDFEFEYYFDNYHKSTLRQDMMKNYLLRMLPYPDQNGKILDEYMIFPE